MCGRFTLAASGETLIEAFGLSALPQLAPRYNIAPGQSILAVRQAQDHSRLAQPLRWGLIPSWAKDPGIAHRLINARAETAAQKPSFRSAFRHRRCLLPADGFYEWLGPAGKKQPYYFHMRNGGPFAIAGLWEQWQARDGADLQSCTLLTTTANAVVARVHQRMPVILQPRDYTDWLDPRMKDVELLQALLQPFPAEDMGVYPVADVVNRTVNDGRQCIEPLSGELNLHG